MVHNSTACRMWSLPIEVPLLYGNPDQLEKPFYVHTVDDNCRPSAGIATDGVGLSILPSTVTFIKQDCCMHKLV